MAIPLSIPRAAAGEEGRNQAVADDPGPGIMLRRPGAGLRLARDRRCAARGEDVEGRFAIAVALVMEPFRPRGVLNCDVPASTRVVERVSRRSSAPCPDSAACIRRSCARGGLSVRGRSHPWWTQGRAARSLGPRCLRERCFGYDRPSDGRLTSVVTATP